MDDATLHFPLTPNPAPLAAAERAALMEAPVFGKVFTDHMARATWTKEGGWGEDGIVPLAPLPLHPGAAVLHYAQEVFEGLKAYRWDDGSVHLFRPERNAARLARSAARLALPQLPEADMLASLHALVQADRAWVPSAPGSSLYLRPFLFASEPSLLVQPAATVEYVLTASPVMSYLTGGAKGVSIWVPRNQRRAVEGGTGEAKTGGNYAASLLPTGEAYARGCGQVLFLDAKHGRFIEEFGGMNVMVVMADGSIHTPRLSGTILEGITRASIIEMLAGEGRQVVERDIDIADVVEGARAGTVTEVFGCGTAAVVTPVSRLISEDFDVEVGDGNSGHVAAHVRERLVGIQYGQEPDVHGWMRIVD